MNKSKAIYLPHEMAFPRRYVLDKDACSADCLEAVKGACKYNAIDTEMAAETFTVNVSSIVWATGWNPYDRSKLDNLKPESSPAIISNMMMERMAAPNGPTGGKILRPGDDKEIESIAFVQCAGSRDENHLEYCSYICCMATFKQMTYIRERYPEAKIYVFYIDLRTPGKYEHFREKLRTDENSTFIKGKVADIIAEDDGGVTVVAEDAVGGGKVQQKVDMCVLATGMQPALGEQGKTLGAEHGRQRFCCFRAGERDDRRRLRQVSVRRVHLYAVCYCRSSQSNSERTVGGKQWIKYMVRIFAQGAVSVTFSMLTV